MIFCYKTLRGNSVAQVFWTDFFFFFIQKAFAGEALQNLIKDVGVPQELVADGAQE
jgi:hypothetical protein